MAADPARRRKRGDGRSDRWDGKEAEEAAEAAETAEAGEAAEAGEELPLPLREGEYFSYFLVALVALFLAAFPLLLVRHATRSLRSMRA
jgi:hypothetical protein